MADLLLTQMRERRQAADPLLPAPPPLPDGERLEVYGEGGALVAVGVPRWVRLAPGSIERAWDPGEQFRLVAHVGGPCPAESFDRLLGLWGDHIRDLGEPATPDSVAIVTWPSRDVSAVPALIARGFQPLAVAAVRRAGLPMPEHQARGVRIRRATPDDLSIVSDLWLAEIRYDARFNHVGERPGIAEPLREEVATVLSGPRPPVWLAERAEGITAMACLRAPGGEEGWLVRSASVAYLDCLSVTKEARGGGVGTALVGHIHRDLDEAGIDVTLLHYYTANPLSAPFWSRMGYRPLWVQWHKRPAGEIR